MIDWYHDVPVHLVAPALVLAAGCGRIGFGASDRSAGDAAGDDAASLDTPAACAPVFADDFEDGSFAPLWLISGDPEVTPVEAAGVVKIELAPNVEAYGNVESACSYDMRDRELSIEIRATPNGVSAELFLQIQIDGDTRLGIDVFNATLQPYHRIAAVYTPLASLTFDPVDHRFWRLIESAGTMRWETSSDRVSWIVRAMEPTPFDLSSVGVGVFAGTFNMVANPGAAVIDNLDVR